jgi:hypothetical protein
MQIQYIEKSKVKGNFIILARLIRKFKRKVSIKNLIERKHIDRKGIQRNW